MSQRSEFKADSWRMILEALGDAPETQFDSGLARRCAAFAKEPHSDVETWNFIKEMLDMCVHIGGGSSMVVLTLDLEPYYTPPVGALCQADGSIATAPWRLNT